MVLTEAQIERQDIVDNKIMKLSRELNPAIQPLSWDIEIIGEIRDIIGQYLQSKGICNEEDFYPEADKY